MLIFEIMNYVIIAWTVFFAEFRSSEASFTVICPPFDNANSSSSNTKTFANLYRRTVTDYCSCDISSTANSRTAILKCDFEFKENIILTEALFPFSTWKVSSAYVRMTNARGAIITSEFLSALMDAPSSAIDLWHCGQVTIEPTPAPLSTQLFDDFKTFIGVGIIDCSLEELPSYFLRDRSRGAVRLKDCSVGRINAGVLHNIEEVRYMIIENTVVAEVGSPISSSGVITLSKKDIHAWNGVEFINSTFNYIVQDAINVTHKEDMEKLNVDNCRFGKLNRNAISVSGDIEVIFNGTVFNELDSMAIQVAVNGNLTFSNNVIKNAKDDSLFGLLCKQNANLSNNTIYTLSQEKLLQTQLFKTECGQPKVSFIVSREPESIAGVASSVIAVVLVALIALVGTWCWRNGILLKYHYRASDVPLCPEEDEEASQRTHHSSESTIPNPTFESLKGRI